MVAMTMLIILSAEMRKTYAYKIMPSMNLTTNVVPTTTFVSKQGGYTEPPLVYSSTEEKLLAYLFREYNPNIIPRENSNESLKLYIGLAMVQLINIVNLVFD
jgi:hypothetical protein